MLASRLPSHAEGLGGLDFYVGFAIISTERAGADACIDPRADASIRPYKAAAKIIKKSAKIP